MLHYKTSCIAMAVCLGLAPQSAAAQEQGRSAESLAEQANQDSDLIESIAIEGAERLEPNTILSYLSLKVGETYTSAKGDDALKDLAETGLFSESAIQNEGGAILIKVTENPVINRIIIEGNDRIKSDKILPEIKLSPRQIFTRAKIRADVARIIELYKRQGRFSATVEPKMVQLSQNRVDVIFEITEGPKSKIRRINIVGNEKFTDDELKDQMVTKETRVTSFLGSGNSYDPDRMAFDQQKLRQFYLTQGYVDFRVVSAVAELTPDEQDFIITYVVEEGERYKFGKVAVESQIRALNADALEANLQVNSGDWYDAQKTEDYVEQLSELAGAFGYAFAEARPQFRRDPENRTMDVTFQLEEAPRVYIERVDVNGNTLTQDKIIRREFRVAEGDPFNSLAVKRSAARINSLGYFQEGLEIDQKQGSTPDSMVLEANVQEQATGELQLSAGFSSTESFLLSGSIKQRNFRGRGQTLGLSASLSGYSKSVALSFVDPYVFDRNISFGADIYRRDYDNSYYTSSDSATYAQTTTGASFRLGVPLSEYMSLVGSYTLNLDEVTLDEASYFADLDGDGETSCEPLLAGRYLCDALGSRVSSIVGGTISYKRLDSAYRPTSGLSWSLGLEAAGLGGDARFLRVRGEADRYWNLGSGFIFSAHAEGGYIHNLEDGETQLTDRFFLGEPSLRGFDIRGIGPAVERTYLVTDDDGDETADTVNREAVGGNAYYLGRAELEIPLGSGVRELGLRPSIFLDVGSVFGLTTPSLSDSPFPDGIFIPTRDDEGNALYSQTYDVADDGTTETIYTTSQYAPDGTENTALGSTVSPFTESYVGDTWKPRISVGVGLNWNSPMGPLRFNLSHIIASQPSDDKKIFSFSVGTIF